MDIIEAVKNAGVVGAGGAGFPTHIKIDCSAGVVIANGAECEPLLRVDQQVMEKSAEDIIFAMRQVMRRAHAPRGVVALKDHYHAAVDAMESAIDGNDITLHKMKSYYPAGDEQEIVYEVTGKVTPTGGIPLDVGAVVLNVSTLVNIKKAFDTVPVSAKLVTVGGAVSEPATFEAPVGTAVSELIKAAGGTIGDCELIIGGPMMGYIGGADEVVTKTTGGILAIPKSHKFLARKTLDMRREMAVAQSVCCGCNMCTQMCPRNALGLNVEPHKAMRAISSPGMLASSNGLFSCCECGICTYYACNFDLNPSKVMTQFKNKLGSEGVRPAKEVKFDVSADIETKKLPTSRLISRLGLSKYDVAAPVGKAIEPGEVRIPLKMHIGAPALPCVNVGDSVEKNALIARAQGNVSANIHTGISGNVAEVNEKYILIKV